MAQPKPKANEKQSKPTKTKTGLIIRKPKLPHTFCYHWPGRNKLP
jgi:hypothetical protein